MDIIHSVEIIVRIDAVDYQKSKYFTGTEHQVYCEALDWMNDCVYRYIIDNEVGDVLEQMKLMNSATHIIIWEDSMNRTSFVLFEKDCEDPVLGVYATLADAEEALFTECEDWTYETMMTDDPYDVYGTYEWDWNMDYWDLMYDCARTFSIMEAPVFD